MKKIVIFICIFICFKNSVFCKGIIDSYYNYSNNEGFIQITEYKENAVYVIVPGSIDGAPVVSIDNFAFCGFLLSGIVLKLGYNIEDNSVFKIYNPISSIEIPATVTSIGDGAFMENNLTNIAIPCSVAVIGDAAFYGNRLTDIVIPNSVVSIGSYAFSNNQLGSVTIPDSVTHIGTQAFRGNKLSRVVLPESVICIGEKAFDDDVEIVIKTNSEKFEN